MSRKDTIPDVALTVNFTQLLGPHDFGKEDELLLGAALNVYVALTENIKDVLSTSRPIYLFPGTHSLAIANLIARQRLRPRELSTLGVDVCIACSKSVLRAQPWLTRTILDVQNVSHCRLDDDARGGHVHTRES